MLRIIYASGLHRHDKSSADDRAGLSTTVGTHPKDAGRESVSFDSVRRRITEVGYSDFNDSLA